MPASREGRLDADGTQDARVPARRRVDHAAALHAHAAGELERARDLLDAFLVARTAAEEAAG